MNYNKTMSLVSIKTNRLLLNDTESLVKPIEPSQTLKSRFVGTHQNQYPSEEKFIHIEDFTFTKEQSKFELPKTIQSI